MLLKLLLKLEGKTTEKHIIIKNTKKILQRKQENLQHHAVWVRQFKQGKSLIFMVHSKICRVIVFQFLICEYNKEEECGNAIIISFLLFNVETVACTCFSSPPNFCLFYVDQKVGLYQRGIQIFLVFSSTLSEHAPKID